MMKGDSVVVEYRGYRPQVWQIPVHRYLTGARCSGKIAVVKAKRQVGKSLMCENELLRYALEYRTNNAMVSPTLNQSRKVFKDIVSATRGLGVVKKKNESLLEIELINGSRIYFKSAEQRDSLRGYTINGILIIDEAAYCSDDILEQVLPWVNVWKAPILIVSTPRFRTGFFHRYYQLGLSGENEKIQSFNWSEYDTSIFLSEDIKKMYKQIMTKTQYTTEIDGEFADDDACVFSGFMDRILSDVPPFRELYVGIDFSNQTGNDDTVISALNEKGEQVYIKYFNNLFTSNQQLEFIVEWLNDNKRFIKCVVPELNSLGTPLTDIIKERCPWCNIQGHITTNKSKNEIVNNLQIAFQNGDIHILNDSKEISELSTYAIEFNPKTRTVTYNAPQGLKDDCCIALALSYKAYRTGGATGDYYVYVN